MNRQTKENTQKYLIYIYFFIVWWIRHPAQISITINQYY
jgi:hypothetical protein